MNWISVKDRLPELGARCLILFNGAIEIAVHIVYGEWYIDQDWNNKYCSSMITHWMALPKAPDNELSYKPGNVTHPCETLFDILEEKGISRKDIYEFIEKIFGVSANFWVQREKDYNDWHSRLGDE